MKILFVCLGNICRSPMAEFIMKRMCVEHQVDAYVEIQSAGTGSWEVGSPVYPEARRELERHGISCDGKTARQITKADYDNFDYLIAMDAQNLRDLKSSFGGDPQQKLSLLLQTREVSDPWYTRDFETAYRDIEQGCRKLFAQLDLCNLESRIL